MKASNRQSTRHMFTASKISTSVFIFSNVRCCNKFSIYGYVFANISVYNVKQYLVFQARK